MIRRIVDVWVMFYFGCGWKRGGAFDTFACSYDLKHWTKWEGKPLVEPSEPYDATYAHKPWVIKHNGVVYHFYCAVGDKGRGIALATSSKLADASHDGTSLAVGMPFRRPPLPASLSGITWAGGNTYYAVSDDVFIGEVGLYPMTIELSTNGLSVVSCSIPSSTNRISLAKAYDLEDVAFDAANGTVWAADETRGTVKEYRVQDGTAVRTLPLPDDLKRTHSNLGIESLTLSADGKTLWTCTEEALVCDGLRSSPTNGTTVRLFKYARQTATGDFALAGMYLYTTDAWSQPYDYGGKGRRGVSGLCALPDGSLLVLERELSFGGANALKAASTARLYFAVYHVDFPHGIGANVRKVKLASGDGPVFAFGNYEGICLGPRLPDGKWSVLLISDAGDRVSQPIILPMALSLVQ